jgi:hypothetical protein
MGAEGVMSEAVRNVEQEFWRPPVQGQDLSVPVRAESEICQRCQTEYAVGARFCHVCGSVRRAETPDSEPGITRVFDFHVIRVALGLSTASLIALVVGLACVAGAIATGLVFSAATVLDWQAVQIWRIQWLLAALVAFAAGILLKKSA